MSLDALLDEILRKEGWPKYTNLPNDRGGPTKGGITLSTLRAWRKRPTTSADVRDLEEDEARAIYRAQYVEDHGFDGIEDPLLLEQVVDCGVLHGQGRASRWLQEAANLQGAGVVADGKVGPGTLAAVNALDPQALGVLLACIRLRFMGEIVSSNYKARRAKKTSRDQSEFALGWIRRATSFLEEEVARAADLPVLTARTDRGVVSEVPVGGPRRGEAGDRPARLAAGAGGGG